jgi:ankyrin repeat protein
MSWEDEIGGGTALHDIAAQRDFGRLLRMCERNTVNKHPRLACPQGGCRDCSIVDAHDDAGRTALMLAARAKRYQNVQTLLGFGADINAVWQCDQQTSLHRTVFTWFGGSVAPLLELGAAVDTQDINGYTPIMHAISSGTKENFTMLLKHTADTEIRNNRGHTALHEASIDGKIDILHMLLQAGADVNAVDYSGLTPLMKTAMCNQPVATEVLIKAGADLETTAAYVVLPIGVHHGRTALHFAAAYGNFTVVAMLLKYGASEWVKTNCGVIPLELAEAEQFQRTTMSPQFGPSIEMPLYRNRPWFLSTQPYPGWTQCIELLHDAAVQRERLLAFYMGLHPRLGAASHVTTLDQEIVRMIHGTTGATTTTTTTTTHP